MQFGNLSAGQQTSFLSYQSSRLREPSFVLWLEGFGDSSGYVKSIDTDRNIESLRGFGNLAIGLATIELNNESGYFYSNGVSKVRDNSMIKVYAGFSDLNVPIFSGIVYAVKPQSNDTVTLLCRDYMGLFFDNFLENVGINQTPKTILDYFCSLFQITSDVPTSSETGYTFYNPAWTGLRIMTAVEKICDSLFLIAYFAEDGDLQIKEREFTNVVDFTFIDKNMLDIYRLDSTEVINDITVSYQPGFFSSSKDQVSIDMNRYRSRQISVPSFSSGAVSSYHIGTGTELLDNTLEGFKFTSDADATHIDTVHLKIKSVLAVGYLYVKIYTNNAGIPGTLLATSLSKPANDLSVDFVLEYFQFNPSLSISASTDYWCVVDKVSITSGTVSLQVATTGATAIYAYNDGTWHTEIAKYPVHNIKGSKYAKYLGDDIIRFYKSAHERIRIHAPSVPQLQLFDEVLVDSSSVGIKGRYVIDGRRHLIKDSYVTIDTLRRVN